MACERLPGESLLEWDRRCAEEEEATKSSDPPIPVTVPDTGQADALMPILDLLRRVGLDVPIPEELLTRSEQQFVDPNSEEGQKAIYEAMYRYNSGRATYNDLSLLRAQGLVSQSDIRRDYLGDGAGGGSSDPYAGAANARAERALQETIRGNRVAEAQAAIQNIMDRQKLRLDAAQFAVPLGTQYAPGLTPGSPVVRSGLAEPFQLTPVPFNADAGTDPAQIAKDLAMLRSGISA